MAHEIVVYTIDGEMIASCRACRFEQSLTGAAPSVSELLDIQLMHQADVEELRTKSFDNSHRSFLLRVTAKRTPSNEVEGDAWLYPQDFVNFLNRRFTVSPDADYGFDAYNKDAGMLILNVELEPDVNPS